MPFSSSKEKQVLNFLSFLAVTTETQKDNGWKLLGYKWNTKTLVSLCCKQYKTVLINWFRSGLNRPLQALKYDSKLQILGYDFSKYPVNLTAVTPLYNNLKSCLFFSGSHFIKNVI